MQAGEPRDRGKGGEPELPLIPALFLHQCLGWHETLTQFKLKHN